MKKIIITLMMVILLSFTVFAAAGPRERVAANRAQVQELQQEQEMAEARAETRTQVQQAIQMYRDEPVKINGLENAVARVRTEEQEQRLTKVLNMIELKQRNRINRMQDAKINFMTNGRIEASGRVKAKFLFLFDAQKEIRYTVQEDGTLVRRRNIIMDILFQETEPDE